MYQRTRFPAWICLSLAVLLLCLASPVSAQDITVQDEHHIMTVRQSMHHDVSPAVRDMPTVSPNALRLRHEAEPARRIPMPANLKSATEPDTVLQRTAPPAPTLPAPTAGLNFYELGISST